MIAWFSRLRAGPSALAVGAVARGASLYAMSLMYVAAVPAAIGGAYFVIQAYVRVCAPGVTLSASHDGLRAGAAGAPAGPVLKAALRRSGAVGALAVGVSMLLLARSSQIPVGFGLSIAWFIGGSLVLVVLRSTVYAYLIGRRRYSLAAVGEIARGVVPLGGLGVLVLLQAPPKVLLAAIPLGGLASVVVIAAKAARLESVDSRVDLATARYGLLIGVGGTMRAIYEAADLVMLPFFVDAGTVRTYGLAASSVYALMMIIGSFGESVAGQVYADRAVPRGAVQRMAVVGMASCGAALLLSAGVAIAFGDQKVLQIALVMAPALVLRSLSQLPALALTAAGRQSVRNRVEVVGGAGNVLLNLLLIPVMGALGAAVATVASEGMIAILLLRAIGHRHD